MGLRETLQQGALRAIQATGNLAVDLTYVHVAPGNYNPATGLTADVTTSYPLKLPLLRLLENELGWFPVPDKTRRVIVPWLMLPIEVGNNDYVLIDGGQWEVKKIRGVPGDAIRILYLQSP